MRKIFNKVIEKVLYVASEYNFIFTPFYKIYSLNYSCLLAFILTPGPMVDAATQDLIYWPLFLLFNSLILASSMGRTKEEIEKLDIHGSVTAKVTILKAKPILMLIISAIIASFHILTNSIIIKAVIVFVASALLSESWTNELKKQILDAIDKVKEVQ